MSRRAEYARKFGELNGWRVARPFGLRKLAGLPIDRWGLDPVEKNFTKIVFDHMDFYFLDRRPVCLVTQPYAHCDIEDVRAVAGRYGLQVHAPRIAKSGWYYPDAVKIFAITRPGTTVKWLPEQSEAEAFQKFCKEHAEERRRRDFPKPRLVRRA